MSQKLARNSLIYVILGFLAPAINFLLLPLYTRYLAPEDYALITLATMFQSIVAIFISPGQPGSIGRIIFDHVHDKDEIHRLYSTAIINTFFTGIIILLIFLGIGDYVFDIAFKNDLFTFKQYGIIILIFAIIYNLQGIILAHYRNIEDAKQFVIWSVLFLLFSVGGIFTGVIILKWKAFGNILGRLVGLAIPMIIYLVYYFSKNKIRYSWKLDKSMLLYGLPLVPYSLTMFLYNNMDSYFIERYLNLEVLGIFSMAVAISNIMEIFFNSVNSAINPTLFKLMLEENKLENCNTINKIYKYNLNISFIVILTVIMIGGFVVHFLLEEKYSMIIFILPVIMVSYISRNIGIIYSYPMFFHKYTHLTPIVSTLTLVIGLIYNLIFIPKFGLSSAIFSPLIMKEVRFWINVFLVNKNNILNKNIYKLKKEIITGYFIICIIIISTFLLKNITPIKFQLYISIVTLTMILIITFINKKLIILGAKKVLNK